MLAELSHMDDDRAALGFAGGCLLAALLERVRDVGTQLTAGLWLVAVITAYYAVVRFICAAHGVATLSGAPDGMREELLRHGAAPAVMLNYDAARPVVLACFLALSVAQLTSAWFLSRRQMRQFFGAWAASVLIAALAVVVQLSVVWSADGVPSEFHGLLVQALAVPALLAWSHYGRRHFRERI